jgi:hypothetical protein
MNQDTQNILIGARALIAAGWCQGASARDTQGGEAICYQDSAVSFCILGAIARAAERRLVPEIWATEAVADAIRQNRTEKFHEAIDSVLLVSTYNDDPFRTRRQVLELLDELIS